MPYDTNNEFANLTRKLNDDEIDCPDKIGYFKLRAGDKGYLTVLPEYKSSKILKTMFVGDRRIGKNEFIIQSTDLSEAKKKDKNMCNDCENKSAVDCLAWKCHKKTYFLAGKKAPAPKGKCFQIKDRNYVNLVFVDKDVYDKTTEKEEYFALYKIDLNSNIYIFRHEPFYLKEGVKNKFLYTMQCKQKISKSNSDDDDCSLTRVHTYHTIEDADCGSNQYFPSDTHFERICVSDEKQSKDCSCLASKNDKTTDILDSQTNGSLEEESNTFKEGLYD
ncbi:uncharacterized protein TRIADDRAFT_60839 [Trichoplax adhaerens]|uniref:Uncharacterized protein n=1 Tax=Trichoplax adhaerens TaxID=10228 RepID=B3S9B0_TRIAD|nr:predicted protein [Trichoplax adhaerens]EDV20614.1 predicted protein [Trichoplax adhaerens]|eukprot:XP_002116814.1 predicted protein [Trichoplax adhaerens]